MWVARSTLIIATPLWCALEALHEAAGRPSETIAPCDKCTIECVRERANRDALIFQLKTSLPLVKKNTHVTLQSANNASSSSWRAGAA